MAMARRSDWCNRAIIQVLNETFPERLKTRCARLSPLDEVLIKVNAASVNPLDWHYTRGAPYLMRLGAGLRKPKNTLGGILTKAIA